MVTRRKRMKLVGLTELDNVVAGSKFNYTCMAVDNLSAPLPGVKVEAKVFEPDVTVRPELVETNECGQATFEVEVLGTSLLKGDARKRSEARNLDTTFGFNIIR
jgi:hypothetical protein